MKFNIIVNRNEDGTWIGECPELPNCTSQGATHEEALENTASAIGSFLEVRAVSDENEQIKEVYATYGLAVYHAQCVERQISILLTSVYGPGISKINRAQYDQMLASEFKKTFGGLIKSLRNASVVTGDFDQKLENALMKRNWLAHDYFWERAGHFMTASGRSFMLVELQEAIEQFIEIDEQTTKTTRIWGEKIGVNQEVIDREAEKIIEDAIASLPSQFTQPIHTQP